MLMSLNIECIKESSTNKVENYYLDNFLKN